MSVRVVLAFDKFRGSATAGELCAAVAHSLSEMGITTVSLPLSDGGEGFGAALGTPYDTFSVCGPLGTAVEAPLYYRNETAIVEMAKVSGLAIVGGAGRNRALEATSRGTGELIKEAYVHGFRDIVVGCGGSATTDGGVGALTALEGVLDRRNLRLRVAADVKTKFVDAARIFGPQKGATPAEVIQLEARLLELAGNFLREFDVDVRDIEGGGCAGGLGGALYALGGEIVGGFDLVAETLHLASVIRSCDLVVTGEGQLDATSFDGKVVGGVVQMASFHQKDALIVCGRSRMEDFPGAGDRVQVVDLETRYGSERSYRECVSLVAGAVAEEVAERLK